MPTDADLSTESERATASQPPRPRKKKKKKAKIARPLEEREINAPDIQTLIMLGSIAALGIVLWIFAHAGCNYHPPRETRRPRNVTTAEFTRDPKGAAIEFQQRLLTANYKGALEIAAGPLAKEVESEKAACDADRARCDARKTAAASAITMGVVLERDPMTATVRVITHKVPDGPRRFLVRAEREGSGWKVTSRVPDAPGAQLPPPAITPAIRMAPMPMQGAGGTPTTGAAPALPPGHP